ncbi:MAG: hypothetical protein LBD67_08615 [Candidatus Accumulibacter sp.]|jgi:hypothetical protein|nr:hypothetical protein [Accumulibacter sp.]
MAKHVTTRKNAPLLTDYILIVPMAMLFIASIFLSIGVTARAIYDLITIYKLNETDEGYETARIISVFRSTRGISHHNIKIENSGEICKKSYLGLRFREGGVIYVKFNEKRNYCIIKGYVKHDYVLSIALMLMLDSFFAILSIGLFDALREFTNSKGGRKTKR